MRFRELTGNTDSLLIRLDYQTADYLAEDRLGRNYASAKLGRSPGTVAYVAKGEQGAGPRGGSDKAGVRKDRVRRGTASHEWRLVNLDRLSAGLGSMRWDRVHQGQV